VDRNGQAALSGNKSPCKQLHTVDRLQGLFFRGNTMEAQITVNLTLHDKPGKLRAIADVTVPSMGGELTIKDYHLVDNGKGGVWVAPPSTKFDRKDGTRQYKAVIECSKALEKQITQAVLQEYRAASSNPT
jgi:DNA-binding cell septation regulator SpoVG